MTIPLSAITALNNHWAVAALTEEVRLRAFDVAHARLVRRAVGNQITLEFEDRAEDVDLLGRASLAFEIAAVEGLHALLYPTSEDQNKRLREQAQAGAHQCYQLRQVLPVPADTEKYIFHVLHLAGIAYCADRWTDLRRWINESGEQIPIPSVADAAWDKRLLFRLYDCWIRLLRKKKWDDLDATREIIAGLRVDQKEYEARLLATEPDALRAIAFRLLALYHLAKASESLAIYMLQGDPAAISAELDQHFDAARKGAIAAQDPSFDVLLSWLHLAARRMVAGSVWWVARAVNSRVTKFVTNATRAQALFELLPPQRAALQEQGLLDQASRGVVVDLPTSGGKTVLAEFRILQALNQFDADKGWVAYVAPTRALVSQITRRMRRDFGPIGINVEQLSSAVEIDSFEQAIFATEAENRFHVLVATPEKLHLIIRNKSITRPLALVVMDEAHNIEDEYRGLRIELLLATIKRDSPTANFLLMMPNVPNAAELTTWLAPEAGKTISLGTSIWQPNERIVGVFKPEKEASGKPRDWSLRLETLTTTPKALALKGIHKVGKTTPLDLPFGQTNSLSTQAVAMARVFSSRGTSIAVARTIRDAWQMARKASDALEELDPIPPEVSLVQRFLSTEISPDFELISMLQKGVGVHHAGLSDEARALIEWLAELGLLRVLCATTTIAQGLNFPVSSVFLATLQVPAEGYSKLMSSRSFWNLAGRAGRIGHDSVGVIGIAAGDDPTMVKKYISAATGDLVSRLVSMLEQLEAAGNLASLAAVIQQDQWADFRIYIAHLVSEKRNIDLVLAETESLLRSTFGYGTLQARADNAKTTALLDATKQYAKSVAVHMENVVLSDATGFSPEGVRTALLSLDSLEKRLTEADWRPSSMFGAESSLPALIGVMMKIPEVRGPLKELGSHGIDKTRVADIASAWVNGESVESIAKKYFSGDEASPIPLTNALTDACKGIYKALAYAGTWGISALSKMPTSGIDFESLTAEQRRVINNLPAMLYHGVRTEEAVLMRMNSVPRSIAEAVGKAFQESAASADPASAREYLRNMTEADWSAAKPASALMSGPDYRNVWSMLSGERPVTQ